jgi:hypothetical protein
LRKEYSFGSGKRDIVALQQDGIGGYFDQLILVDDIFFQYRSSSYLKTPNGFELTCALRFCERATNYFFLATTDRANSSAAG